MRNDLKIVGIEGHTSLELCGVRALYLTFLARWPEGSTAERAQGMSAIELTDAILSSAEFVEIVNEALDSNSLPRHEKLGRKEAAYAAGWIIEHMDATIQAGYERWESMLNIVLNDESFPDLRKKKDLVAFKTHVARLDRLSSERDSSLRKYVCFDAEWFLRSRREDLWVARLSDEGDAENAAARAVARSDAQILPAFSSGLENVYRPLRRASDITVDGILDQVLACLRKGEVSHWLFDADHYRWSLNAHAEVASDNHEIEGNLFLDYLSRGEAEGFSPHPLFAGSSSARCHSQDRLPPLLAFLRHPSPLETPSPIFDPGYYVAFNDDVTSAIREGTVQNALEHFLRFGIFRDTPFSPDFDAGYYAQRYPEILEAVRAGTVPSLSWHFVFMGLKERRQPNAFFDPDFYRLRHPHVSEELRRYKLGSELEHFLVLGRDRGWKCSEPLVTSRVSVRDAKALFQKRARRSYDALLHRSRNFAPHRSATPAISIVVPVCGEMEFTAHFLECAYYALVHLAAVKDVAGEVVIVDNGSSDATDRVLSCCQGLVVARFKERLGFPRAINEGVRRCRGATIVVANNDVEFAPDALVSVLERLQDRSDVGILGGMTILPDETIQEAGSFLDRSGNVTALGRGDNPWDAYYQGTHEADYCTGSFIAFRHDDFDYLDGFDETFSPGYYEETDFALRMAKELNKRVCVDSSLKVVHFEHASFAKGRPATYASALMKKNRARLLEKHRADLGRRCALREPMAGGEHAPAALGRRRLLVIEDLVPDQRLGSGFGRAADLLRALSAREIAFDLLALAPNLLVDDFEDLRVTVHRAWMPGMNAERFIEEHGAKYSHVLVCRTHNLRRFASQLERLRRREGVQIICDTEALGSLRRLELDRLNGLPVSSDEEVAAVRDELDVGVLVSTWIAVNSRDRDRMMAVGLKPILKIGYGLPAGEATTVAGRFRILAVGAMHSAQAPNYQALVWFIESVLPRLPALMEAMTFTIVGFWDPEVLACFERTYAHVRLQVHGAVSDDKLARLYSETRVCLAPTRFAGGVPIKVLDAFSRGVPIIITDLLSRQIALEEAEELAGLAVAATEDGGEDFARWLENLCLNDMAWTQVVERQRLLVDEVAGMTGFMQAVDELVRHVNVPNSHNRTNRSEAFGSIEIDEAKTSANGSACERSFAV